MSDKPETFKIPQGISFGSNYSSSVGTLLHSGHEIARLDRSGNLIKFDAAKIFEFVSARDPSTPHDMMSVTELLLARVIEHAASMVDHILKEGGGTYGDAIRNMKIDNL